MATHVYSFSKKSVRVNLNNSVGPSLKNSIKVSDILMVLRMSLRVEFSSTKIIGCRINFRVLLQLEYIRLRS